MANSPTWPDIFKTFKDVVFQDMLTSIPAKIVTYDPVTQKASVQVHIQRIVKGQPKTLPNILEVPVWLPVSSSATITFPINKGDTGLLIFCQRSLDVWKSSSTSSDPINPMDNRKVNLNDCIFLPGVFPFGDAPNDPSKHNLTHDSDAVNIENNIGSSNENQLTLKSDGSVEVTATATGAKITLDASGVATLDAPTSTTITTPILNVNSDTSVTVTSPVVTYTCSTSFNVTSPIIGLTGAVTVAGPLAAGPGPDGSDGTLTGNFTITSGDLTADGISLKSHTHPQAADSGGNTEQDTGAAQ